MGSDHDAFDLIGGAQQADAADEKLLGTLRNLAAADVGVPAAQSGVKLLQ